MPHRRAKQTHGNATTKENIAEKVKEIQKRQKNWMQQRASDRGQTANTVSLTNSGKTSSHQEVTNGNEIVQSHHSATQKFDSHLSSKNNLKVKHGFDNWLQACRHTAENDQDDSFNYKAEIKNGSRDQWEEKSELSTASGFSSSLSLNRTHPLSPTEFDSLADSIISRVKRDLGIKHADVVVRNNLQTETGDAFSRGQTFVMERPEMAVSLHKGDSSRMGDINNHCCPFCSALMATSGYIPTLLGPCGHTVCKSCAVSHGSCRLCGTRVTSAITNITLQQIIQEFQCKNHQINYSSKLLNLLEREVALQKEVAMLRKERDNITSSVHQAERQLIAIEREEKGLVDKLQQLQDQLQGLREHREQYAGECLQLQQQQKLAADHVLLAEETLNSLREEIEKVQFLAEGQKDMALFSERT